MIKQLLVACILMQVAACSSSKPVATTPAAENTLSKSEISDGWKLLFDGTTTNGWHVYNRKTDGSAWKAGDGTLYFDPTVKDAGGDLTSEKEYQNFDLKLDWKLEPNGNSGLIFQAVEDPKYKWPFETGPEMQILDNVGHPDAKIVKHRSADLYDLITSTPETVKPAGEWNSIELIADKGTLTFFQNGVKVLTTKQWDDNWTSMIANSKFKKMPDFGKFQKGHIALQDHGNKVWFKNIKIKEL
jgi:hypothetical protein